MRSKTAFACIVFLFVNVKAAPVINTAIGEIHGISSQIMVKGQSVTVSKYLGIPFAEPPVGDLRFRKPVPLGGALGSPFNATSFGYICPQVTLPGLDVVGIQDEDCLYLNVYVPDQPADQPSGHAVMIWIYGGSFILGSANSYGADHLVALGNVIYVTFNYRVGPFGFLSTGDDNCPGNFGLWDQRLAMQWVNDHIGSFGGDTNRVTIFGESAGGISSIIHGMYPDNSGLFQRMIAESGVPAVKFIDMTRDTMPLVGAIATQLGCLETGSKDMITCMRQFSWREYMQAVSDMYQDPNLILFLAFDPVVDGEIIKHDPKLLDAMEKHTRLEELEFFRSLDLINGFNMYEGGVSMQYFTSSGDANNFEPSYDDMLTTLVPMANMVFYRRDFSSKINRLIAHEYTNWSDPYNYKEIRVQYAGIHGDAGFSVPAVTTSLLHAQGSDSNSYMYTFLPIPTHRFPTTPLWLPGADHGDEVAYVIGIERLSGIQQWEIELSRIMMTYWANFAKTGYVVSLSMFIINGTLLSRN